MCPCVLTRYHNSDFCLAVLESTWDMRHLPAFLWLRLQSHAFVTEDDSDISHLHKHSPLSTLRCPFPFGPFLHPRRWTWCSCIRPFPRWIQQLEWWSLLRLASSDTKWWSYQQHQDPTSKCASLGYPTSGPKPCWTACPCCLKWGYFSDAHRKAGKKNLSQKKKNPDCLNANWCQLVPNYPPGNDHISPPWEVRKIIGIDSKLPFKGRGYVSSQEGHKFLPAKNLPLPEATSEPVGVLLLTSRAAASLRRCLVLNRRHPSTKETEALKISETGNFASKMVVFFGILMSLWSLTYYLLLSTTHIASSSSATGR